MALTPCAKTLQNHIKRAHFVALMWKNADRIDPIQGRNPIIYGWKISENELEAEWFSGHPIPEFPAENEESMTVSAPEDYEDSDNAWSEDSDDGEDEENI